jgi:thioredoxin-related protein
MFMRPNRLIMGLAAALLLLAAGPRWPAAQAARDLQPATAHALEIVVIEVGGCKYCPRFRQDIAEGYARSTRAREVPLRFVDVSAEGADRLKLKTPVNIVPTAILLRDNAEIGRIEGYVGPEDFSRLVADLLRH